jgi:hypothetical protein
LVSTSISKTDKYAHDASPSWNGFIYQGKVGLYVVLKMIDDQKVTIDNCKEFELELEWLEDFSIKKDSEYMSIHQVKSYSQRAPIKYNDAIWLLLAKLSDFPNIKAAYLHSTAEIDIGDKVKFKSTLYDYNPPKEHSKENNKPEELKKYWSPRRCHDYVKDEGYYDEAYSKFELYTYEGGKKFCAMDDIEDEIKSILKRIRGNKITTSFQLECTLMYLCGLVDHNIRKRHSDIQHKYYQKVTINFQEFFNIISKDYEQPSQNYMIFFLRNKFVKLSHDYLEDLFFEVNEGNIDIDKTKNLQRIISTVNELDDEDFLEFCKKITPDHEVDKNNPDRMLSAISSFINDTKMNDCFFEILKKIKKEYNTKTYTFNRKNSQSENISYLPTTINDKYNARRSERLVNKILKHADDDSLQEVDVMITEQLNISSLEPEKFNANLPEHDELKEPNYADQDMRGNSQKYFDRISKIKKIKMIDAEKARKEIDDERDN